ncbi:dienelactone hydrolase family protein [bacterium]|nr:dienelactone hydrolase family protein [bacterium]
MRQLRWIGIVAILISLSVFVAACGGDDDDDDDDVTSADDDDSDGDDDVADDDDDDTSTDDDTTGDDDTASDDDVAPFVEPDEHGPYEVGVRTIYLTDESRYYEDDERARVLPLEIWYPTDEDDGQINTAPDMVGDLPDWALTALELAYQDRFDDLWSLETSAWRDAEISEDQPADGFPVILFSHGLTAIRFQNYTLCEHLASHGFVVVAPDHYGNAIFTNFPGGFKFFDALSFATSYIDRPKDVDFIRERLIDFDDDASSDWYGKLNMEIFGVTGHSYGGMTSLQIGAYRDYAQAIAPLTPGWIGPLPEDFRTPTLLLQSDNDSILPGNMNTTIKEKFDESTMDFKVYIQLQNAGHYAPSDACALFPPFMLTPSVGCDGSQIDPALSNAIVSAYVTAFFKSALLGDTRYDDYLGANHYPDDMEYSATLP